jgi:type IV pilus assembly protein PilC
VQFFARVGTPEGAVVEQVHHASDAQSLRQDLQRRGFHVFEVRPKGTLGLAMPKRRSRRKLSVERFLVFNQELAALLAAGLPLLQCLELMLERMRDPMFRQTLVDIKERVSSGQELSAAFEVHADLFPRLYPSTLRAGERSGDLEKVIRRFVRYLTLMLDARKKVVSALVYPIVLVCLSLAMIIVMTVYVVPKFAVFYADLEAELPLITRITLGTGNFLRGNWFFIIGGIALTVFFFQRWRETPTGRIAIDHAKLRIPILGPIFHRFGNSELTRSLATLVDGGLPLVPSLEIAVGAVGNAWLRDKLEPTVQRVREGKALHAALEQTQVLEDIAIDMVKVGETTGALGTMLTAIADFLDQEVEIRMSRLLSLVEPLMLVFMGIIIAVLLISVYLPMFSVLGQVK